MTRGVIEIDFTTKWCQVQKAQTMGTSWLQYVFEAASYLFLGRRQRATRQILDTRLKTYKSILNRYREYKNNREEVSHYGIHIPVFTVKMRNIFRKILCGHFKITWQIDNF